MKKVFIGFGVFFGLILAAIVILPFVIDVDQYRPKIVEMANKQLNGKLELGKLRLSLWGKIQINVEGAKVVDAKGAPVVSMDSAEFYFPYWSFFKTGSAVLTFEMKQPDISVVKEANGSLNVLKLYKGSGSATKTETSESAASDSSGDLPGFVEGARLDVSIVDAKVSYDDIALKSKTEVKGLNLKVEDISLTNKSSVRLWGNIESSMASLYAVKGSFELTGNFQPQIEGKELLRVNHNWKFNGKDLEIGATEYFKKGPEIPMEFDFKGTHEMKDKSPFEADVKFFNAEIKAKGSYGPMPETEGETPPFEATFASNSVDLGTWSALIPMLKEYQLAGILKFDGNASNPNGVQKFKTNVDLKDVSATGPKLKAKPVIQFTLTATEAEISPMSMTLTAPGTDLKIDGTVKNYDAPVIAINFQSNKMDFDQWVNLPKREKMTLDQALAKAKEKKPEENPDAKSAAAEDYDAMLKPLRDNPTAKKIKARLAGKIGVIQATGVTVSGIVLDAAFNGGNIQLDKAALNVFKGAVNLSGNFGLMTPAPTYRFSASMKDFDLKEAIASQFDFLKNTFYGDLSFDAKGNGQSFNPDSAIAALDMNGNFELKNAKFASLDLGPVAQKAVNEALGKLGDKIPALKGKQVKGLEARSGTYDSISSSFSMKDGVFRAPNFVGRAGKGQGLDIKGDTTVVVKSQTIDARWAVIDRQNALGLQGLSASLGPVKAINLFQKGNEPVELPISIGCQLKDPCFKYTEVPEYLVSLALSKLTGAGKAAAEAAARALRDKVDREARAAADRLKAEANRRAQEEKQKLKNKAVDEIKKKVKLPW